MPARSKLPFRPHSPANRYNCYHATFKLAICVSTEADFGMARMFGLLTDGRVDFETQVFRDWQPALD